MNSVQFDYLYRRYYMNKVRKTVTVINPNALYSWDLPMSEKLKIIICKLDKNFHIQIHDKTDIQVFCKNFRCWYSDDGDNSLAELLNNIEISEIAPIRKARTIYYI